MYPRLAISAPRSSERPKLGHDVPLIDSTDWSEPHLAPTPRDPELKHKLNFDPHRFMTANVQNYARQKQIPVDTVQFGHKLLREDPDELKSKPASGCYIYGLFLEGARWDKRNDTLTDPKPKELFAPMPVIHLVPEVDRAPNPENGGIYRCPVYKILTRTGTLSTTGHSTNFVFWLEVPSTKPTCYRNSLVSETNAQIKLCDQAYWIKAGVACFCALKY